MDHIAITYSRYLGQWEALLYRAKGPTRFVVKRGTRAECRRAALNHASGAPVYLYDSNGVGSRLITR